MGWPGAGRWRSCVARLGSPGCESPCRGSPGRGSPGLGVARIGGRPARGRQVAASLAAGRRKASRRAVVLVCGERTRGDDGAALVAVDRLPPDVLTLAEIRHVGALEVDDVVAIDQGTACLIVDAAIGLEPGAIVCGSLASLVEGRASLAAPRSSHVMTVSQVLSLAAIVRPGLPRGAFVGIGGSSFGLGEGLSAPVERGLPAFVGAIAAEIERLTVAPRAP